MLTTDWKRKHCESIFCNYSKLQLMRLFFLTIISQSTGVYKSSSQASRIFAVRIGSEIALMGSLMFACGLFVTSCCTELICGNILAVEGGNPSCSFSMSRKIQKKLNFQYFWSCNLSSMVSIYTGWKWKLKLKWN